MKGKKGFIKKVLKNKKLTIALSIVIIAILAILYIWIFAYNRHEKIDSKQISMLLSKESELTTAKLNGTGFSVYKDKGIKIWNRSDFLMTYDYTVRAGVDMEKVEVKVDEKDRIVFLKVPKAEIFDVKVAPDTIKYYDTKFALFNVNEKEDAVKAQTEAEKHAKEAAKGTGILEMANEQAEMLIKGILAGGIPKDYKIQIER